MAFKQFSSPHTHPHSLDTGSQPQAFVDRAKELGATSVACTDHGSMAAVMTVHQLASKAGLIGIPGIEAYMRDDDCPILEKLGIPRTDTCPRGLDKMKWKEEHPRGTFFDYAKYFHLTMHFRGFKAYKKGVKILSKADLRAEWHGSERKPLFDWNDIEELAAENVTIGSGCLVGAVQRHLLKTQNTAAAEAYFARLHSLFGDRMFVEVFPHRCTHNWDQGVYFTGPDGKQLRFHFGKKMMTNLGKEIRSAELAEVWKRDGHTTIVATKNYSKWEDLETPFEIANISKVEGFIQNECAPWAPEGDIQWGANRFVLAMAQKYKKRVHISDDGHLATVEDKVVQDVRLAQSGSWKFFETYEMKSSDQAWEYFRDRIGIRESMFEGWIENSLEWAEGFKDFKFDCKAELPTKFYPTDTLSHTKYLIQKHGRMRPEYKNRLKEEIELFHRNGTIDLLPYFAMGEEVCRVYRDCGLLSGPGRGSAAGTILSYLLGITHVDPLKYDLSLERFLTKDRINSGALPDIDFDFPGRDLLVGGAEMDVLDIEASDGSLHSVPSDFRVETTDGEMTIAEAVEKNVEFKEWWVQ